MSEQAQITLRRKWGLQDAFRAYKIELDGSVVQSIRTGKSVTIPIAPGKHSIRLTIDWCGSDKIEFDANAGEDIQFECRNNGGGIITVLFRPQKYLRLRRVE